MGKGCEGTATGSPQEGTAAALQVCAESPCETGGLGDSSLVSSETEEKTSSMQVTGASVSSVSLSGACFCKIVEK